MKKKDILACEKDFDKTYKGIITECRDCYAKFYDKKEAVKACLKCGSYNLRKIK